MALLDWQFISIVVSIIGSAVGATAWITWKMAKADTEIKNLKDNLKKAEDDIKYMFRLSYEQAPKAAERVIRNLVSKDPDKNKEGDKED
ncbi:hypothetical protein BH18THE2_BH18THE2_25100 [soil metagenome]